MKKTEKMELADEYRQAVESAAGFILFDYRGLPVEGFTQLRRGLRSQGAYVRVIRNRMLRRAVENFPFAGISEHLVGPTALTVASRDPAALAKVLLDFAKDHEQVHIKCGVVEGRMISARQVVDLARLPSREVLLAQILSGVMAPMAGLAACLVGLHRQLLGLIEAYRAKLEEAPES